MMFLQIVDVAVTHQRKTVSCAQACCDQATRLVVGVALKAGFHTNDHHALKRTTPGSPMAAAEVQTQQ